MSCLVVVVVVIIVIVVVVAFVSYLHPFSSGDNLSPSSFVVLVRSREREISQCLVLVFVYLSRLATEAALKKGRKEEDNIEEREIIYLYIIYSITDLYIYNILY